MPLKNGEAFYLNVARTKSSDETFNVTIHFSWPINPPAFQYWQGPLQLFIPRIGQFNEADTATQQIRATVWVPKEYTLVGEPENFSLVDGPSLVRMLPLFHDGRRMHDNWFSSEGDQEFDFPTDGVAYYYTNLGGADYLKVTWWNKAGFTVVLSAVFALIGLVLVRTTWENKIGFLLLLGLAAVLWAQTNPDMMIHAVLAARFGIIALVGLWVIHSIAGWFQKVKTTETKEEEQPSEVQQEEQHHDEHHQDENSSDG